MMNVFSNALQLWSRTRWQRDKRGLSETAGSFLRSSLLRIETYGNRSPKSTVEGSGVGS